MGAVQIRSVPAAVEQAAIVSPNNVSFPTDAVSGDYLVLLCATGGSSATAVATPTGWTSQGQLAGTANTTQPNTALFTRRCDGTEGGVVSVAHVGVLLSAQVLAFTGVDTVTPIDVAVFTIDQSVAQNHTDYSTTVVTAGSAMVLVGSGVSTTATASAPTNFVLTANRTVTSARTWGVAYRLNFPAAATGTVALGWSGSLKSVGIMIMLRPAIPQTNLSNNYQFVKVGDGMSTTERIR